MSVASAARSSRRKILRAVAARYLFDPAPANQQELIALMTEESRLFAGRVKLSGYVPE